MPILAKSFNSFDPKRVPSPCFVVDKAAVEYNLKILSEVQEKSGAKILAALKAFSCFSLGELTGKYLSGICASGIHEALLGKEYYGGEIYTFSAGFKEDELKRVLEISNHVVFNSMGQWQRFQSLCLDAKKKKPGLEFGLRINPRHSEGEVDIYDPCAVGSRLGIPLEEFEPLFKDELMEGISGLHFHTLCEHQFEPLARTLDAVEDQFGKYFNQMKWINFGGGHHITKPDYDRDGLINRIKTFSSQYNVQVYLEPGEAIAIHSGVLVTEVVDTPRNGIDLAILDTSATCHMPDTLEMPYRPEIFDAGQPGEKAHTYRLGGMTCLAGDVINEYSFDKPLQMGQRLVFDDMSHYTMVKTTTFNGINLPTIAIWNSETDELQIIKEFGYDDFKNRLS